MTLLCASQARADDLDDLFSARDAYGSGEYATAIERLNVLSRRTPPLRADLVEPVQRYIVASLLLQQPPNRDEAERRLRAMFQANPDLSFGIQEFGPPVQRFVNILREQMLPALNALRVQHAAETVEAARRRERDRDLLREFASREAVAIITPRWLMFIPFGIGQFANGDSGWGVLFAGLEATLVAAAVVLPASLCLSGPTATTPCWESNATASVILALDGAAIGAAVVTAALGIVQANVAYHAERSTIRRRTPPPDVLRVIMAADPHGGATVGIGVRF